MASCVVDQGNKEKGKKKGWTSILNGIHFTASDKTPT